MTIYEFMLIIAEPTVGELRYIARLNADLLPNEEPNGVVSNIAGGTAIEGSDVFLVDGQTRCKFYSSERFIDDQRHCKSIISSLLPCLTKYIQAFLVTLIVYV